MNKQTDDTEIIFLCEPSECLIHPFNQKQIVFTGALSTMTRSQAAKHIQAFGGIMQGAVTQDTDFLILGDKRRGISTKQVKAEHFISHGLDIQIIPEADFMWVISMHKE